ncbi:MAG TPA: glycosyltransferase [Longimicrobiaceae bacterium]|nr:glycosyltransferase [Longimicrobiaceae bacterium]
MRPAARPEPVLSLAAGKPKRVGIVCDFAEEGWPSMDLAAELLALGLAAHAGGAFHPSLLRPHLPRRLAGVLPAPTGRNADRWLGRYRDYPRWLRRRARGFDLFHVVDHSYAHLVHVLPPLQAVVTCHDLDAFRSLLDPAAEPRPWWFRRTMRRVLEGLRAAAHVLCDSAAIRDELLAHRLLPPGRVSVAPLPVHPDFSPEPDAAADAEADALLGPFSPGAADLLHVGSTVPRKRIDRLLRVFAAVRRRRPEARLVRVGGALGPEQRALAERLGVAGAMVELPFLGRRALAAVYRRAALVLNPSERVGFGLPLVEAMACATPVAASDLPAHREVGGEAVLLLPGDDDDTWADAADALLRERADPGRAEARRRALLARAEAFSLAGYAERVTAVYRRVLGMPAP